ncbi:MAG: hypothetical protein ING91_19485 [Rhodocyclaceae bacterium]|nr:hypothetical protein [Rhodocyclaceae bacterium]MCA3116418.1 hypothetical protein [Rhodocyclaceae bacterium]
MTVGIENQAYGKLAAGIGTADTTLSLQAGQGVRFGAFPTGTFKYARMLKTSGAVEFIKITARASDSLTVVRAQQGSTALSFSIDDRLEIVPDKGTMAEFPQLGLLEQLVIGAGTANAITGTLASGGNAASLLDGFEVTVRAPGANTVTNPTFNLTIGTSATGAKTIVRQDGGALVAGDISAAGFHAQLSYRLATDRWVLMNAATPGVLAIANGGTGAPSLAAAGIAQLGVPQTFTATQVADNGTAAVSATGTYTFDGTDQIRTITLTNAITVTFGAPTGIVPNAYYTFRLVAGDASARAFAWNSAYKFPAGAAPLIAGTTFNGASDIITFIGGAANTLLCVGHQADVR